VSTELGAAARPFELDRAWALSGQVSIRPERFGALLLSTDEQPIVEQSRRDPVWGAKVVDEATLRCAWEDGTEPYVIHHYLPAKPWLEPTYDGPYSRLLRRLLARGDVAVRVPRRQIPFHLRRGLAAYAERKRINVTERLRWRLESS